MRLTKRTGTRSSAIFAIAVACFVLVGLTQGGFAASASNPSSLSSATLLLEDTIGATSCQSTAASPVTSNQGSCTSSYPMSTSAGSTTTTLTNLGNVSPKSAALSTTATCGVQDMVDSSSTGTNTALAVGGVTYGSSGPTKYAGSSAVTFNGSSGWAETLNESASPGPQTFSVAAWFETSSATGSIFGYSNDQYNSGTSNWDRMAWVDSSGHVVFGVYPGSVYEISSSQTTSHDYADGSWHFLVVTVSPVSSSVATVEMYLDGALVAGSAGDESTSSNSGDPAQAYAGWWQLGWSNAITTWTDPPTSAYWNGSLADVAVFPTALPSSAVSTLYSESSQSALQTAVLADSPTSYWGLQDNGQGLYTGSIADLAADSAHYGDYSGNPGTNYGTGQGTLATTASGPIGTSATTFNGSTGFIETNTQQASPGPQTFSIAAWFKTSSATGMVIGYTNAQGASGTSFDRAIWIDPNGHLDFAVGTFELSTTGTYDNGSWQFVVVTVTPITTTLGTVLMYVNGTLVAGTTGNEVISASHTAGVFAGYWHLGWGKPPASGQGFSDAPSSPYWNGSLGQIAVFGSALTQANVTSLYGEPTYQAYSTAVTGGAAASTGYWPLNDSTTTSEAACSYVTVTVQAGSTCIYPSESRACPSTPPVTSWLSPISASIPVPVSNLVFDTLIGPGGTTVPADGVGLHVSVPITISEADGFTASLAHDSGYVLL